MKSVEIIPYSIIGEDNKLFCSDKFNAGIYEIDILTAKTRLLKPVSENQPLNSGLYTDSVLNGEKIFFVPHHSNSLAIYDKRKMTIKYVDLPIEYYKHVGKFSRGIICESKIYLFGYLMNKVLSVDVETDEIKSVDEIENEFNNYLEDSGYGIDGVVNDGNTLYISSNRINIIFKWNTKTGDISKIKVKETRGINSLLKCGDNIVALLDNRKSMMIYSIKNDSYRIIELNVKNNIKIGMLINYKQNIYAFPQFGNEAVVFNMESNEKRRINWGVSSDIWNGTVIGNNAYLIDSSNMISIFDFNTEKTNYIELYSTEIKRNMVIKRFCKENTSNNLQRLILGVQLDE